MATIVTFAFGIVFVFLCRVDRNIYVPKQKHRLVRKQKIWVYKLSSTRQQAPTAFWTFQKSNLCFRTSGYLKKHTQMMHFLSEVAVYDQNNDGHLDSKEFKQFARGLAARFFARTARRIFRRYDTGGNDRLESNELDAFFVKLLSMYPSACKEDLAKLFDKEKERCKKRPGLLLMRLKRSL